MGGTAVQRWSSESWGGWLLASLRPSPRPLLPATIRTGKPSWYLPVPTTAGHGRPSAGDRRCVPGPLRSPRPQSRDLPKAESRGS